MRYSNLSGLEVKPSRVGLGGWQLDGHGWGKVSEKEMVKAVQKAVDCGTNFFDTAPISSLERLKKLLSRSLAAWRKNTIIATNVGLT